ncbi:SPOR domain-containing protein [Flavobacterium sp. SM2513]|uniref:HU domain-containing protein n=1 Tax=Flavobacterium sp. SM2513 TaxID=3424766 RepID=UPI003D7F5013
MEQHIAQLLYRYQCVTVPGFGAFLTEIQPAQLVESTNTFYPPKKVLSFNGHLKNNDGLLANHIAQAEKIAYEIAVQNISKEVSLWKNALLNQQNIVLNCIGTLHLNASGTLNFEASSQVNFHTSSFGLNSYVSPLVKREVIGEIPESVEIEPIALVPETTSSSRNSYLKYAAVFILALTAAGSIGYKMYDTKMDEEMRMVQTEVQKDVQNKIQEATFFIENPLPNVTLTVKEDKKPYHIVAGAFSNEANAQKKLGMLKAKGFNGKILERNKYGLVPVLYGSYSTYAESQLALKEIHKTENKEAWLLIKD